MDLVTAAIGLFVVVVLGAVAAGVIGGGSTKNGYALPPVVSCGVPLLGGFIEFIKGPLPLVDRAYNSMGEVFSVPLFHKKITFLIGPDASPHFFKANDENMSQKEVYKFNVPTFGPGVVFDVDHIVRREQFRFFADSLQTAKLKTYVTMMVEEAEAYFTSWGDTGVVDLLEELSSLIILTASRCLMGREVREHLHKEVFELFHDLDMGMQPISVIFPYLPIEAHRKRDSSRKKLAEIFSKVIGERRKTGAKESDLLQTFIDAKYKDGRHMTDVEITGMLIAVLFAGQHTSSITSTWVGLEMFDQKDTVMPAVLEEQRQVMKEFGDEIHYDSLNKMDRLYVCIKEALRLHPPLIMLMRYCHKDFTVKTSDGKEYIVPKDHIVATSPTYGHYLESVWNEPKKYDPERFLAPREEDKKKPFSYIGFGGGRHGCMGENFAYLQIKTIWSVIIRNFDIELVDPKSEPNFKAMVVGPKGPCKVRYTRRKL